MLNHECIVGIEPSSASLQTARARFAAHRNVEFAQCFLSECPCETVPDGAFDTVICLNVLEPIEDDVDALSRMRRLCGKKGRVVVLVPAHMSIYGQLDRSFGHHRRYNRRTLGRAFEDAGLKVGYSTYMNVLGYFGWWWQSRVRRLNQIPVRSARVFNRMVPFLDAIERLLPRFFGQSIIMIGTPE